MLRLFGGTLKQSQNRLSLFKHQASMITGQCFAASSGAQRLHFSWSPAGTSSALSLSAVPALALRPPSMQQAGVPGQRPMLVLGGSGLPRAIRTGSAVQAKAAASSSGPTRPPSAYNLFIKDRYTAVKAQEPAADMKRMAVIWRQLSETEKSRYTSEAESLKPAATPKAPKVPKEPKTPKRAAAPVNAYTLFVKETYPALKKADPKATLGSVSPLWKGLTEAEQQKFRERAAVLAEHFYKENPKPEPVPKAPRQPKAFGAPKAPKRPPSAYNKFVKQHYADEKAKTNDSKLVFSGLSARWKSMPEAEKAQYA